MRLDDLAFYKKNGWIIIRNFFNKNYINKIKNELLKNTNKKSNFFYYEIIKNKPKLRRIEKVSDFSKSSKNLICSKKTLNLINNLENKKNTCFLKIN